MQNSMVKNLVLVTVALLFGATLASAEGTTGVWKKKVYKPIKGKSGYSCSWNYTQACEAANADQDKKCQAKNGYYNHALCHITKRGESDTKKRRKLIAQWPGYCWEKRCNKNHGECTCLVWTPEASESEDVPPPPTEEGELEELYYLLELNQFQTPSGCNLLGV